MKEEEKNLDLVLVSEFEVKQLKLLGMDVNKFTSKKKNLSYLSWSHAWEEFLKVFPFATYHVRKDTDGNAFFGKPHIGYMVFTTVTVMGLEREMWLLVMDGANKSLKDVPYTYEVANYVWKNNNKVRDGVIEKKVDSINMFDINKTIMRCLVKNLAMFGLGIYIYKGEDLPTENLNLEIENASQTPPKEEKEPKSKTTKATTKKVKTEESVEPKGTIKLITDKQKARIHILLTESGADKKNIYSFFGIKSSTELNETDAKAMIDMLVEIKAKQNGNIDQTQMTQIIAILKKKGFSRKGLLKKHGLKSLDDMTYAKANEILTGLRELPDKVEVI